MKEKCCRTFWYECELRQDPFAYWSVLGDRNWSFGFGHDNFEALIEGGTKLNNDYP